VNTGFKGRILVNIMLQVLEHDIGLLLSHKNTEREVSFQDSSESDNFSLLLPSPEFPFGEASSYPLDPFMCGEEPPGSQLPDLKQDDLDPWLNDGCTKQKEETTQDR
jgi:hypothetical protein